MRYILGLILLASSAAANAQLTLGVARYGGSGCRQGSVTSVLSPDKQQLSILFDRYEALLDRNSKAFRGWASVIKDCNFAIPVSIPPFQRISVQSVDYRGFNSLPDKGISVVSVTYGFNIKGGIGRGRMPIAQPIKQESFVGPLNSNFFLQQAGNSGWSQCGGEVELTFRTSVALRVPALSEGATVIDSADYAIQYRLIIQGCRP